MVYSYLAGAHAMAVLLFVAILVGPIDKVRDVDWRHVLIIVLLWPIVLPMAMVEAWEGRDER